LVVKQMPNSPFGFQSTEEQVVNDSSDNEYTSEEKPFQSTNKSASHLHQGSTLEGEFERKE